MKHFNEKDIVIVHYRGLQGTSGTLRITHIPSGLSVWRDTGSGPVVRLRDDLLEELARKVAACQDMETHEQ